MLWSRASGELWVEPQLTGTSPVTWWVVWEGRAARPHSRPSLRCPTVSSAEKTTQRIHQPSRPHGLTKPPRVANSCWFHFYKHYSCTMKNETPARGATERWECVLFLPPSPPTPHLLPRSTWIFHTFTLQQQQQQQQQCVWGADGVKVCHWLPGASSHLKGTVEVSGEFDQLLLHCLADGAAVTVQGHAVHQQETEERKEKGSVNLNEAAVIAYSLLSFFNSGCCDLVNLLKNHTLQWWGCVA